MVISVTILNEKVSQLGELIHEISGKKISLKNYWKEKQQADNHDAVSW